MKKIKLLISASLLSCTSLFSLAQDDVKTITAIDPAVKAAQEKAEKAWMEYMTPGPMHEMMAKSNGDWHEEITTWMQPGTPPVKSTSTCHNEMILGGRYQQSTHKGDFSGMPFEGMSIVAYDNALKMYISTWIDNMGTGIMVMKGTYDEKNKILSSTGTMVDPVSGKEISVRETLKFVDDNTQIMEMFDSKTGKEYKTMEIKFTR